MVAAPHTHKVFKYSLPINERSEVLLPKGALILSIMVEHGREVIGQPNTPPPDLWIWALVDPLEDQNETRTFRIAGTGHDIDVPGQYITTVKVIVGQKPLYFHVFEEV